VDMADGQALPPLIEDGAVWHVVRRSPDHTTKWRAISIASAPASAPPRTP
jgi:hypothetical protein